MEKAICRTNIESRIEAVHLCPDEFHYILIHKRQIGEENDIVESLRIEQGKDGTITIITDIKHELISWKQRRNNENAGPK